jgi:protein-tyrosine phosphatase
MIKILFICTGNICRSPMSEFILKDMVEKRGIADQFKIASAATSTEEIWGGRGNPVYPPAQEELRRHGIGRTEYTDFSGKRARQVTRADYEAYDYLLCADAANIRSTIRITGADTEDKIHLLLDYAVGSPRQGKSIADPWYSGEFGETYRDIVLGCEGFLSCLEQEGKIYCS